MLLGEPADEGVARGGGDGARQRGRLAGEQPQQRRLARAVGPDDPDDVTRGHGEVEVLEEGAVGVPSGQVLRHEGCAHPPSLGVCRATPRRQDPGMPCSRLRSSA